MLSLQPGSSCTTHAAPKQGMRQRPSDSLGQPAGTWTCLPATDTAAKGIVSSAATQVFAQGSPGLVALKLGMTQRPKAAQVHLDALEGHLTHVPAA